MKQQKSILIAVPRWTSIALMSIILASCGQLQSGVSEEELFPWERESKITDPGGLFDEDTSNGINFELWQASLSTIGFFGIKAIDPETGTIVTNFYSNGSSGDVQATVLIHGPELTSGNISVLISSKINGESKSNIALASRLKDAILLKARELRQANKKFRYL